MTTNYCGSVKNTPSENVFNKVFETDLAGRCASISPDLEPEVVKIVYDTLTDETMREVFLSCYGLGGRVRESQRDVAKRFNLREGQISRIIAKCIELLRSRSPARRLSDLAVAKEDVYAMKETINTMGIQMRNVIEGNSKMLAENGKLKKQNAALEAKLRSLEKSDPKKTERMIEGYRNGIMQREATITERDETIANLREELARAKYESAALRKRLTDTEAKLHESELARTRANNACAELQSKWNSVLNAVGVVQKTESEVAKVSEEILSRKVDEIFEDHGVLNALRRAHIETIGELVALTESGLRKLRFGKSYIKLMKIELEGLGLSLRAA